MAEPSSKSKKELLAALRNEFELWEDLLARLSREQIVSRELPSHLSIKDVMAHLDAWQRLSIARVDAALNDREPDYLLEPTGLDPDLEENLEQINAWIHESNLAKTWPETYRDWREGFLRFLDLAEAIPERDLMNLRKYRWLQDQPLSAVLEGLWDHHQREHYVPLVEWLRKHGWISDR